MKKANGLPGEDAAALNRSGDLSAREGDLAQAMASYGGAIDAYVELQRYTAAAAVASKLLRLKPEAIRTRCTLAWIDLAQGFDEDAVGHIEAYATGCARIGRQSLARRHLAAMGRLAEHRPLRLALEAALEHVEGDPAALLPHDEQLARDVFARSSVVRDAVTGTAG